MGLGGEEKIKKNNLFGVAGNNLKQFESRAEIILSMCTSVDEVNHWARRKAALNIGYFDLSMGDAQSEILYGPTHRLHLLRGLVYITKM